MSIRKWFKGAKAKAMIVLGSFAMLLGVGASVSVATAVKENEVVETKAGTLTNVYIHTNASGNSGWVDAYTYKDGNKYTCFDVYFANGEKFCIKRVWSDGEDWPWGSLTDSSSGSWTTSGGDKICGADGFYTIEYDYSADKTTITNGTVKHAYIDLSAVSSPFSSTKTIHWGVDANCSVGTAWRGISDLVTSQGGNKYLIEYSGQATVLVFCDTDTQTVDIAPNSTDYSTYYVWNQQDDGKYVGHWGADREGTFLVGGMNSWLCTSSNILSSVAGKSDYYQITGYSMSANDEWLIRVVSAWDDSDTDYGPSCYVADGSDTNASALFDTSGTNFKANANGSYDIFYYSKDSTHRIYGYYNDSSSISDGYYLCGTNEFGAVGYSFSLKYAKKMSTGDGKNTAYYTATNGISVSNGTKVKPRYHSFCNNTWYSITLGGSYGFAGTDGDGNIVFSAAGNYNFYFKIDNGTNYMYIVDVREIHTHGYLYFASSSAAGSINVTTSTGSETVLDNVALSTVEGLEVTSVAISFDGYSKLYRMPIFNLRGSDVSKVVVSATFSDGTRTLSSIPNNTSAQHVYAKSGEVTTGKGAAAKAVFEVEAAMNGHSICDLDDEAISPLKGYIEAGYSGDSSLMNGAKITTCPSGGSHSTFNTLWEVSKIYKQICRQLELDSAINANGWTLPSLTVFGGPNNDQSPLTLTLWIVLGAGVLGLGAIGTAYFVSKKKKRHQA